MQWRDAVWAAVQRQAATHRGPILRERLIDEELPTIIRETDSKGATPHQTLSRILQELRDAGVLIFAQKGVYRLSATTAAEADLQAAIRTQTEALVRVRIGQSRFRRQLLARFDNRCPLTGITEPALLRASHIVPWRACPSDAERLNPDNGIILSALWDAAFDSGLVSFADDGAAIACRLGTAALSALTGGHVPRLAPLTPGNRQRLTRHRAFCETGEWPL